MTDLSILIPSRNEMFLSRTIEDILANMRGDTEIIAVLDGDWSDPPVEDHPLVRLIYYSQSIGQRGAVNAAAKIANGRYLMKVDAHCAFAEGFDIVLMEDMQPDWTTAPLMRNLHAFDWVCPNEHVRYQGPSGDCKECGAPTKRVIRWIGKTNPASTSYTFDNTLHFQYFNDFKRRPEGQGDVTPSMSLQGSCFMCTREKYFELNLCDETWGSWGNQGTEVACKTWLSGGKVMINHKTWYAHMFRTQGGDFGFPYHMSNRDIERARQFSRDAFLENTWEGQIYPLAWLVKKFWPVPGWSDEDLAKLEEKANSFNSFNSFQSKELPVIEKHSAGIVYYTDNRLDAHIMTQCQRQLLDAAAGIPIVSVSLAPIDFGDKNIVLPLQRGYLTMFKQILAGLEALDCEYVFFAEHDVLYSPTHFEFVPQHTDRIYYNINVWKIRWSDRHALHYDCQQTSGLCGFRDVLIQHYRTRVQRTQEKFDLLGDSREFRNWIRAQGFEPGTHGRQERVDDLRSESWWSDQPNVDIRHDSNLTPSRWRQDEFRNHRSCRNWIESDEVPGWEDLLIKEI